MQIVATWRYGVLIMKIQLKSKQNNNGTMETVTVFFLNELFKTQLSNKFNLKYSLRPYLLKWESKTLNHTIP